MSNNIYLLDTNVLIEAKNMTYRFSFCNPFWEVLLALHEQRRLFSIQKVKQEIMAGDDELKKWVENNLTNDFFLPDDDNEIMQNFSQIIQWAEEETNKSRFSQKAFEEFAGSAVTIADPYLLAVAKFNHFTIVTQELRDDKMKKKIQIPIVAQAFTVNCINIYDFLEFVCDANFCCANP